MFPRRRRHPLTTFRFWFFVFSAIAVTLAWRLDMLPVRIGPPETGRRTDEAFTEVDLSEPGEWQEPVRQPADPASIPSDPPLFAATGAAPVVDPELANSAVEDHVAAESDSAFQRYTRSHASAGTDDPAVFAELSDDETSGAAASPETFVQTTAASEPVTSVAEPTVLHADVAVDAAAAPAPTIDFAEIDQLSQSNVTADHIEAHRKLSSLYWEQPEVRREIRERIDLLAQRIYFQSQPHYMPAYEVQPGEVLQEIGKRHNVSWQYLARLNQVDPQRIRAGQRLKIIKGPFSAVIDLSDFELTVHAYGYYVTRYPVGIGKDGSTPLGTFTVQNKQVDPTYYGPDGVVEHDDPTNPLGERWIDIGNSYGIHGTIDPGSIGRSESRGCIRMHNEDVAAVFDLLTVGSEVTIHE